METFSCVYFPNAQVLFSVYKHRSNSCLDNHRMTLKNQYSLCHQKHLQRKSVLREICTRRRLLWFKFWALCLPNIFQIDAPSYSDDDAINIMQFVIVIIGRKLTSISRGFLDSIQRNRCPKRRKNHSDGLWCLHNWCMLNWNLPDH